jgi:hypothetical protein
MAIMIGIHQQEDKVDKRYENIGLHAAALTAVGPFPAKGEALTWQQVMQQRIGGCQIIELDDSKDSQTPWHGFSFER